jgi:hypothetical protein
MTGTDAASRYPGEQRRWNLSMMIMRPPQQGQACFWFLRFLDRRGGGRLDGLDREQWCCEQLAGSRDIIVALEIPQRSSLPP